MINRTFWEDAKKAWVTIEPPKMTKETSVFKQKPDSGKWKYPLNSEEEEISMEDIDFDEALRAAMAGQMFQNHVGENSVIQKVTEPVQEEVMQKPQRPKLDEESFEKAMAKGTLSGFAEAAKLLKKCCLPEEMDKLYAELIQKIPVLEEAITKSEGVYQPIMDQFYEYYIPEALQLTATYLEYLDVGIGEDILEDTEKEVIDAIEKLIQAVNEKKDEIYKYASIEIKAKAKALEALMSQGGFVDSDFKL